MTWQTFLCELKGQVGYDSQIKYQAGKLTLISLKFGKTILIIKTQQLLPDSIDGQCDVSSEEVYNNLNKAMVEFHNAIFKTNHKSTIRSIVFDDKDYFLYSIGNDGIIVEYNLFEFKM